MCTEAEYRRGMGVKAGMWGVKEGVGVRGKRMLSFLAGWRLCAFLRAA